MPNMILFNRFLLFVAAGVIGSVNMVCWGLYGDLLVERFQIKSVLRSLFLGVVYSIFILLCSEKLPLFIVVLCAITFERITTEIYKAFIRHESQIKYKIPSDLNINLPTFFKMTLGLSLIVLLMVAFYKFNFQINLSKIYQAMLTGLLCALGGMLKDARYEGFDLVKFFRSPLVAFIVGILLMRNYPNLTVSEYIFAVAGAERIISEFYKKIWHGRLPGKFKNIKINKTWQHARSSLLAFYALDVALMFVLIFVQ